MYLNLEIMQKGMIRLSSLYTRTQGKKLLKESYIKDLKGKNIDNIYHIYGKVLNDNKSSIYRTHIKINNKTDKIIDTKCTCETFKENRKQIKNYVCKHIVGTFFAFYSVAKKNIKKKEEKLVSKKDKTLEKCLKSKRFLSLDIIIKCIVNDGIKSFQCEFKIGVLGTHLITDIKEFIRKSETEEYIKFNEAFTYNKNKDEFIKEDKEIIEFIKKNKNRANGKCLKLYQNEIKDFLKLIHKDKKIILNYNFINYEVKVKKINVPVSLTVRLKDNKFILRHHNKFPILLNNYGDVMLFDGNIYLPKEKQLNSYIPLYKKFIKSSELYYDKSLHSLNKLLEELKNITNNVVLDENIKEYKKNLIKPNFYFYKEKEKIYCNVKLNYSGYIIDLIKNQGDNSFLRDYKKEILISMELEKLKFIKKDKDFMFIGTDDDIFNLLNIGFKRLNDIGIVKISKDLEDFNLINSSSIYSSFEEFDNFYTLKYNIYDFTIKEIKDAISNMRNGNKFYKRKNSYLDLEDPGVVQFLNLIEDLGFDNINENEIYIDKNKSIYISEKLKNRNLSFIKGSNIFQEIVKKLLNKEYKRKLVPKKLNGTLRNYQKDGFKWINEVTSLGFGCILADDMGLGKTIQIIAFLLSQKKTKSLVVTPTALIYNWQDEFEKFAPTIKVGLVHGNKNTRENIINNYKNYDVILTTYGTLKNDEEKYKDITFDYFIIDEAQNIKNPTAKITETVKNIKSKSNIALTGTPIENNLIELWSIFDFIMPGYLFSKERFRERFINTSNTEELKSLITPFVLRRVKEDVLDELPDKVEKKYLVELNSKQKSIYKSYVKEIKNKIKQSNNINLFSYLTKLRELCLDPSLVIEDYSFKSSKIEFVKEIIDNAKSNKKILLFSQFTSVLKNIEYDFKERGIKYTYLDGKTSAKERVDRVKLFNEDKDIKVFLISLKAGGVGLNLTSANLVIHFDPWWNPAIEDQATDRAHRFGQKNIVEVIKLVAKDTIEEKIVLMQEDKKELIQSLMDGKVMDGQKLKKLTEEEIMKLFD